MLYNPAGRRTVGSTLRESTTADAQADPELDAMALPRAGARVTQYRLAHTKRRHGRRYSMTQDELARRAGVSTGCLQSFENATRRTGLAKIRRIAAACEMTLDELFAPEAPFT